jgi:protein ImuB
MTYELPIEALRIPEPSLERCREVGILSLGQLYELPRHSLADRFGRQTLYRLAQLLGSVDERIHCVTPRKHYQARKIFEPPLTHRQAITAAIQHLFRALINSLQSSHIAAKLFILTLQDTSGNTHRKELPLASATNDLEHLTAIIQPIIDGLHFCGELREITIEATQTSLTSHQQRGFAGTYQHNSSDQARAYQELLNTFSVRLGKDRISYAGLTNSFIPERAFTYRSAVEEAEESPDYNLQEPSVTYSSLERPPILFSHPEPITTLAMLPDKPPSRIRWRETNLAIISGSGPERIAPEWWRGDLQREIFSERDYFTVQDSSGRWLWVYRDNASHAWFVHGVWIARKIDRIFVSRLSC